MICPSCNAAGSLDANTWEAWCYNCDAHWTDTDHPVVYAAIRADQLAHLAEVAAVAVANIARQLAETGQRRTNARKQAAKASKELDPLIRNAVTVGMTVNQIAVASGLTRQGVYDRMKKLGYAASVIADVDKSD